MSVVAGVVSDKRHARLVEPFGFDLDALRHVRFWVISFSPFVQADNGVGVRFSGLMALAVAPIGLLNRQATQRWIFALSFGTRARSRCWAWSR